jgi:hypothetical protein
MDMKLWKTSFLLYVLVSWPVPLNFFQQPNICEISMSIMCIFRLPSGKPGSLPSFLSF